MNRQLPLKIPIKSSREEVLSQVPGLILLEEFLNDEQQERCIEHIDAPDAPWELDLSRRTQQFGSHYDFRHKKIRQDPNSKHLPDWIQNIAVRLHRETNAFSEIPNQVIINEYLAGQGIEPHADDNRFGPTVAILSLIEEWEMDFTSNNNGDKHSMTLPPGSCLLLTKEARYQWQHGIERRKTEPSPFHPSKSQRRVRNRRVSITFRTMTIQKD